MLLSLLTLTLLACGGGTPEGSGTAPLLSGTTPADGATGISLNTRVTATFDSEMQPLSATTFTLKQGSTVIASALAHSTDGTIATLTPTVNLAPSTRYTATLSTEARSAAGDALATARTWSFTTGTEADATPPQVRSTGPTANATGVATNRRLTATFSEAMDPVSLTSATFTVRQGSTPVSGNVTYGPGTLATFVPASSLAVNARFDATLSTGVRDLNGNALAAAYSWSFTTGTTAARGPAPVGLGTADDYAILAKTGVSSVPDSTVTGDIGLGPAAASYLTGFSLVADATNVFATSTQLVGRAYAANYAVPTPSNLTTAVSNMESAYTDAASRPTPDFLELGTGNLGGRTLAPGLYKWTSSVTVPTDVTLSGGANDVWILQSTGDLTLAANTRITLAGGALAKNIFWQIAGRATFGAGAHFEGILLCKTDVTLQTGATMNGRILSQTQVALQQATVTQPAP
ncbi:DUF3494 domain-containing protein [Aggregicoccus sp. 17bor-14]|uniref:ice-binding family protein n=1 Tax=Myxococcaceae TaxID=31 RepID=UPI00129C6A2E|nr:MULTISPECIES: ice-binding family protein [Myxococcaceae]MBF5041876.1 DUF3494 domain-containing protein [Simulacricoccus sp. 17bor-14]MRI87657.1 DUF3494 domain-containing protein [Aggregicoccus sp. 17bor-14]